MKKLSQLGLASLLLVPFIACAQNDAFQIASKVSIDLGFALVKITQIRIEPGLLIGY